MIRAALLACALLASPAAAQPRDVVSLNLCSDDWLVLLAPDRIAALSPLARDPALSVVAAQAARWPSVRPDAEAVLRLHPRLVLAGTYGTQTLLAVLRRAGIRVVQLDEPQDFPAIAAQARQLGTLLGAAPRAEALVAGMNARLAAVPHLPPRTALLWQARGYTAGPGSFGDAVLAAAGLRNQGSGARLGLEALLARPPQLLVTDAPPAMPSVATDLLRHPALTGLPRRTINPALLECAGPWSADAVAALAG